MRPRKRAQQATLAHLYGRIWHFARGTRRWYLFALVLLGGSVALKLVIPWLAAQAINTVQVSGYDSLHRAGWYVALVFLVYIAAWAMHGPGRIMERNAALRVRAQVSDALYAKLVSLPLAWHESHHSAEVQQRTQQASAALAGFTENQFLYVQNAINIVGPLVALSLISSTIGVAALIGYVLVAAVIVRFDYAMMRLAATENVLARRYTAALLDFLGNVSTVLSLRLQNASRALVRGRLAAMFEPIAKSIVVNEGKWCAVDLLSAALTWSLVGLYAWLTRRESQEAGVPVLLGGLFMIYQYAQQVGSVVGSMAMNLQGFARMRTDYASADPIWEAEIPPQPNTVAIAPHWRRIVAHSLEYRHAPTEASHAHHGADADEDRRPGIRGVTLTLERGQRIALIGPSGSGKSTLLRVLAGLYQPMHGYYHVDGDTGFGLRNLSSIATLVPQETEVFEASVRDNLTFGVPHGDPAIHRATYASAFDSVVDALPGGLDTPISERGFNLSGGQRQRLALARGFLAADPKVAHGSSLLLLDEPTSALDQETEMRVFRRLAERMPDVCIVASIHRMSALAAFDKVVLMQAGHIVDCGTADELMARQPLMRKLVGTEALAAA